MHGSSMNEMRAFDQLYVREGDAILEVGSLDVNGSCREIFEGHDYLGIDWSPGPGVDIAIDGYDWNGVISDGYYDIVISAQAMEHDPKFWLTLANIAKATKPGGHVCIIVPRRWDEHRHPVDCYRFLSDAMRSFGELMGMEVLKAKTVKDDTIGIFRKVQGL